VAKVLTLNDIAGMTDKKQLILSKDTIITPAARDWAKEKGISIIVEGQTEVKGSGAEEEKDKLLNSTIVSIVRQLKSNNMTLNKDEIASIVKNCLERMNCMVD